MMFRNNMNNGAFFVLLLVGASIGSFIHSIDANTPIKYDYAATTECKSVPDNALYNGGIISPNLTFQTKINTTTFALRNLTLDTIYSFSSWVKIRGGAADSSLIKALITGNNSTFNCTGNVLAKKGCWSFFKGGFIIDSPLNTDPDIYFMNTDGQNISVIIASASLQPFSRRQWEENQQHVINTERKRSAILHVIGVDGKRVQAADVIIKQVAREFPFGTVVSDFILGNKKYQKWFLKRFNAAVFENELKWYATEPVKGKVNYTVPDNLLRFLRSKQIMVRGHNVLWDNPNVVQEWVKNLTASELRSAANSRIQSVMGRYRDEFVNWDVNNEMLPFDFFENRLGPNASIDFFRAAQELDTRAGMFMNEFNVLETCDAQCSVDRYVLRLKELVESGVSNLGIGLQSHFNVPNPALIRGVLDKLATMGLPIWMTEVDLSKSIDYESQAKYLEVILREGFSHPSINGIMLWTGLHGDKSYCYRMCLTDYEFKNLPSGDMFDKLMKEWYTEKVEGKTNERGIFHFSGFLGDYEAIVRYGDHTTKTRLCLGRGMETKHINIYL